MEQQCSLLAIILAVLITFHSHERLILHSLNFVLLFLNNKNYQVTMCGKKHEN